MRISDWSSDCALPISRRKKAVHRFPEALGTRLAGPVRYRRTRAGVPWPIMIERLARHPAGDCSVSVEAAPAGRTNMIVPDALESIIRRDRIRNAVSMRIEESLLRPHANNLTLVRLVLASSVIYTDRKSGVEGKRGSVCV